MEVRLLDHDFGGAYLDEAKVAQNSVCGGLFLQLDYKQVPLFINMYRRASLCDNVIAWFIFVLVGQELLPHPIVCTKTIVNSWDYLIQE